MRMMIGVPVLAPCCDLKRTKPPYVHAGVIAAFLGMTKVREAVDETLHVQRVDEADCAEPKEAHPAEAEQES